MSASKAPKPESLKVQPWTDFTKQLYTFFTDDFVEEKRMVAKVTATGDKGSVTIKETLPSMSKGLNDDIKINVNVKDNRSIYMRIKSGDYLKVHYDNGITQVGNNKCNLYGTINTTKSFSKLQFKTGAQFLLDNASVDNRLKLRIEDMAFFWYHRSMMAKQNWKLGFIGVFNLSKGLIQKNNIMFNYIHNEKHNFFLRAQVQNWREAKLDYRKWNHFFDNVIVDYIGRLNDTTRIGLQTHYNFHHNKLGVQLVTEKYIPEKKATVKAKINKNLTLAVGVKIPMIFFQDLGTIKKSASYNYKSKQFKWGVQCDINL